MEKDEILEEIKKLKEQLKELNEKIIDKELPKNYDKMTDDEKKAYHQRQEKLIKEALSNLDNYSVIKKDYTIVQYPKKRFVASNFAKEVGNISAIPIEKSTFKKTVPEKTKEFHKKQLEDIEKLIERYNSTKAIRNDRIEFGVNFDSFCETYFGKLACLNLNKLSNKRFLESFAGQLDKNNDTIAAGFRIQNLTDEQRKELIKIRIKSFVEKLEFMQKIASAKVKRDSSIKVDSFLDSHGILSNDDLFRDGSRKYTTVKSVVSGYGIDMSAKNNIMAKRKKSEIISNATFSHSRYKQSEDRIIELNILHDKFIKFTKEYKGNGRQFSIEFCENFKPIADKLYNQKAKGNSLSFSSENLSSSPISVQQHEIEKQFEAEFKKANYRMRYAAYFIPCAESVSMIFLGKTLTNEKTQTEKNLDKMKVQEYEKELKNIALREDLVGFDIIIENLNNSIKIEFEKYLSKNNLNISSLNEISKKSELKKFMSNQITDFSKKVRKNKFFSLGTDVLEKLNGVLINRNEKLTTKEMKNIFDSLGQEQGEIYKHILQSVKEYKSKYEFEKSEIEKLGAKLEKLSNNPYSADNNKLVQNVIKDINAHNKKIALVKSSLDNAQQKKLNFENNFAKKQIDKAIVSNASKVVSYNTSKSVFDKYDFPAVDAFGETYLIEKGSLEAKQVEKVVASFIMNFKNQIQNMKLVFDSFADIEMQDYISRLENRIDDDFGLNIRELKKTQKFLKSKLDEQKEKNKKEFINELEMFAQRLGKIESDFIKKLKSMNIEIGNITLAKK